jgi:putative transcriptional regulator
MQETTYLNNQFLIAMPNLADPNFSHTVTYLCQHNHEGALGIVINRPTEMKLGDIFQQMAITASDNHINKIPIFMGGPVQPDRGFVIHSNCDHQWDSSLPISDEMSLTTSQDILIAIAKGEGPGNALIALGYAGWGEGQLEKEMIANSWLNTPCTTHVLFDTPAGQRWNEAAIQIGVDINLLTTPAGHG